MRSTFMLLAFMVVATCCSQHAAAQHRRVVRDSLLNTAPIERKQAFYHPFDYPASDFNTWWIDMYRFNITTLSDTFKYELIDDGGINRFRFPIQGRVTSGFGPRTLFSSKFHYGTDIKLEIGDTIVACMGGVVRMARTDPSGYGKFILIAHPNGLETLYGHLSDFIVKKGDVVWPGKPIGLGGNSGQSTGAHLHFEFRLMGKPFNPELVVDFQKGELKTDKLLVSRQFFQHLVDDDHADIPAPFRVPGMLDSAFDALQLALENLAEADYPMGGGPGPLEQLEDDSPRLNCSAGSTSHKGCCAHHGH